MHWRNPWFCPMGFNDVHNGEDLLVWLGKAIRLAWRSVFAVKKWFSADQVALDSESYGGG